ncbi:hypothetical protein [Paucibacter soli]|uniref:hypothetical protein n=1 Tax=Paucibacter soli TaxID=3133433 RepID=UPI00309C2CB3
MNAAHLYAVLLGGSIAGALDILFAISFAAYQGATPVRLLQTVASGLLGSAAFAGGLPVAALGLALHPLLAGGLFGALVFLAMRLLVLPLSAFPYPVSFKPLATALDLLSHMLLFGVPIAWAAQRALLDASAKA